MRPFTKSEFFARVAESGLFSMAEEGFEAERIEDDELRRRYEEFIVAFGPAELKACDVMALEDHS